MDAPAVELRRFALVVRRNLRGHPCYFDGQTRLKYPCRFHGQTRLNLSIRTNAEREFIKYKTSMITDEDPLGKLFFSTRISVALKHYTFSKKGDAGAETHLSGKRASYFDGQTRLTVDWKRQHAGKGGLLGSGGTSPR